MLAERLSDETAAFEAEIDAIRAVHGERDRERFSRPLIEALGRSPLTHILQENRAAGPGTLVEVLRACRHLGRIDTSLGWVVGVANSAWSMRANFGRMSDADDAMRDNRLLALVLGRPGVLSRDGETGSFRLNGTWGYASGSQYASMFFGLAMVEGSSSPDVRVVAVPAALMTVRHPWNAVGLRGTQSVMIEAKDIVIPQAQTRSYGEILSGATRRSGQASYGHLFTGVLMNCLQGSVLGACEAALDHVTETAKTRPVTGSTFAAMADSGALRAELGRLRGELDLILRAAEYNADRVDRAARNPAAGLDTAERVDLRGRVTRIMRSAVAIVQDLLWIYGSSGLDRGDPLERIWRDVNVGARHGGFAKLVPEELAGRVALGLEPTELTRMF